MEELTTAKRILVPLDQSPAAEVCVPLGASIARGSGATLRPLLMHLLEQFWSFFAVLLWVAGVFALLGGMAELGWAIFAVIVVNSVLGPPLRDIFGLAPLAFAEWSVLVALPPAMLALEEGRKWLLRKRHGV